MSAFYYRLAAPVGPALALAVLQTDETIEADFRRLFDPGTRLYITRVPSAPSVTSETLAAMERELPAAATLLPRGLVFDAVGYGCTSASAEIGSARVAAAISKGVETRSVTEPLSALVAAARSLGISRIAFLSPYIEPVSARLRRALAEQGLETPVFGSFDEASEARVARIDGPSIIEAGKALAAQGGTEALFLSCTNLRTLDIIAPLEAATGLPVLSSNLVLAWHMAHLARIEGAVSGPGHLLNHRTRAA
ncbi:MAG: Asp/Glu racemase [Pseudomonadota bacterium]